MSCVRHDTPSSDESELVFLFACFAWLHGSDVSTVEKFMRESKSESVLHKYLALTSCLLENGGMSEPVPYVALTGLLKLAGDSTLEL